MTARTEVRLRSYSRRWRVDDRRSYAQVLAAAVRLGLRFGERTEMALEAFLRRARVDERRSYEPPQAVPICNARDLLAASCSGEQG